MAVFGCLGSGRTEGSQDFSKSRVLPEETSLVLVAVLQLGKATEENCGNAHQVNTCCSSGLGNVVFGGVFGDEINVPSSNCDRR